LILDACRNQVKRKLAHKSSLPIVYQVVTGRPTFAFKVKAGQELRTGLAGTWQRLLRWRVPSPVGHVLAGVTVAWVAEALPPLNRRLLRRMAASAHAPIVTPLAGLCAVLAVAPDFDILLASHRTYSHSLGAVAVVAMGAAALAATRGWPALATALACSAALGSHILLDWLGRDTSTPAGLMALWPISSSYVYSGVDLFAEVSRRYWKPDEFTLGNALSVAREVLILGPATALAWWFRRRQVRRLNGAVGAGELPLVRRG
jgi:membrane-bound metal-dependent hydrolase YbcI (DUF457 family)